MTMIKEVLLIDIDNDRTSNPESQLHSQWSHHPIGLMYIASSLRKQFPQIKVSIFHTITSSNPYERIIHHIREYNPELIGLRALSIAGKEFRKISDIIRKNRQDVPIVAGGPYPSSSYNDILNSKLADLVVIGEGEQTFVDLIQRLSSDGRVPDDLPGTAVLKDREVKRNIPRQPVPDLDTLPFPDYSLINIQDYKEISNHAFQDASKSAFICSSRGCPYGCVYCHQLFGKKIRRRSGESIVTEMEEHYHTRNIRNFVFVDDLFNVPMKEGKKVLIEICEKLPDVQINFPNGLRADQIDDEMIDLLEQAGTVHTALAVESASPRIQKMIGKNLNLDKAFKAIDAASRKFIVCAFFMIGFPSETYKEAMETIEFAEHLEHLAEPTLSVVRVYNKTPLYDMLQPTEEQEKALISQEQENLQPKLFNNLIFYGDLFPDKKVPLKGNDIQTLQWEWVRRVFNNPKRIINSHRTLLRHMNQMQVMEFYRNLFDNPKFGSKSLKLLLKKAMTSLDNTAK
jgi:radical SAM superfamily enzyme YgiQ (UPF0313 family)